MRPPTHSDDQAPASRSSDRLVPEVRQTAALLALCFTLLGLSASAGHLLDLLG